MAQLMAEYSDGFHTTVLPAATMWASAMEAMSVGKLYGVMTPTTPSGRKLWTSRLLFVCSWVDGNDRPRWRSTSSPAFCQDGAAYSWTSSRASSRVLPISRTSIIATGSARSANSACTRRRTLTRSISGIAAHAGCAARAARTASSTSAASQWATAAIRLNRRWAR